MKCHQWTERDDELLKEEIKKCEPIFEHFRNQGKSYSDMNAWDAVAGRLWDSIGVTGAACRRRYEKLKEEEKTNTFDSERWQETINKVDAYERDLAETTFDGVAELLGNVDAILIAIREIKKEIKELKELWK